MKNEARKLKKCGTDGPGQRPWESYLAPCPPKDGRIVGLDCHPDTYTAAVYKGSTPHDACKMGSRQDMSLAELESWVSQEFTRKDLFLLEAGTNSFEICRRLYGLGMRAVVMESAHVGRNAKTYADNDKMAAARIALVYLAGNAPCVWVPDDLTCQRRELLHAHQNAVVSCTASTNALKGYLTQRGIRLGGRNLETEKTWEWILRQREWSPLQKEILREHFRGIKCHTESRVRLHRLMSRQICEDRFMLRCMKLLGVGIVNAFALLATIGDVRRFERPEKLVAYLGLNPGSRTSGLRKQVKVGVGKRGRGDMRRLLIQGAHAVLRRGRQTPIGMWGWKLFARKGNRNTAIAAVARKMVVQIWHLLSGNPPMAVEGDGSLMRKLAKLAVSVGKELRAEMGLPVAVSDCVEELRRRILETADPVPA